MKTRIFKCNLLVLKELYPNALLSQIKSIVMMDEQAQRCFVHSVALGHDAGRAGGGPPLVSGGGGRAVGGAAVDQDDGRGGGPRCVFLSGFVYAALVRAQGTGTDDRARDPANPVCGASATARTV